MWTQTFWDCFELCGHKLFEISEKVYDSGNISMKCSPYYTFGECVEKCYNHHDTTVSLQFLKKCDEAVHHATDCFELCGHKLFEISEKVYDSGNISMKCSPYYTFGECVEKCYNHHDTTVSLQFLKKCDEAVHHAYSGVSKHKKCLQQNFGKAREHCSLKCAKKALEETIDEDTASRNSSSDEWEQSSGSLCLNQICRLDCLYDLLMEKCPGASEGVMNALLAPFDVFGKMMKKFSSHHSFEKSVNSSSCKDLFGGIIIENRLDNSLNTTNEVDALDKTMSDFVSSFKPTPPAPLEVVSKPHSTRLVKKQISDYPIYDMDYSGHSKGGNIYEDYLNGGGNSIYDYYDGGESQDQSENGNNQNVLYQVNHNFNGPAHTHTLDVQPSNYRFTGPASDECGDIMILDDNEQIPLCSTPTIYFITSPQNTIKTILL
uniref:CPG4 domain-containing protein n=1 Tax=Strongyloides papillosus TaxID=174720 RepID=A0A0N5BYI3_STREA